MFSGRFLSFYSSRPHKIGTIYNLIDKAFLHYHPKFHLKNLEFAIKLLLDNCYSLDLIFMKFNDRLKILINKKAILFPEFVLIKKTIFLTIKSS